MIPLSNQKLFWVLVLAAALVLSAQAVLTGCVDKETEDIDSSEGDDDTAAAGNLICGKSFDEDIYPFFSDYCLRCHSESRIGDQRNGAPEGVNFDTLDDLKAHAEATRAALLDDGGMPPSDPTPSMKEYDDVLAWIDCAMGTDWQ